MSQTPQLTQSIPKIRKKTLKQRRIPYERLYNDLTGFGVSVDGLEAHATMYGELDNSSIPVLYEIFSSYAPLSKIASPYRNFYDIGCGIGKIVVGFAHQHSSLNTTGIEIVPERVKIAHTALERLRDESIKQRIEILCISMLDPSVNYADACWIFVANLCFTPDVQTELVNKLVAETKAGCILICSKEIQHPQFDLCNKLTLPMSWSNESKVYVYRKK
jgi:SAM-dependent methyltransferase